MIIMYIRNTPENPLISLGFSAHLGVDLPITRHFRKLASENRPIDR